MFLHHVADPLAFAGSGIEADELKIARDGINVIAIHGGGGAGAIAAFVIRRAGITATFILGDAQRRCPEGLAIGGIQTRHDFLFHPIDHLADDGESLAAFDGERAEAIRERAFPDDFRSGGRPGFGDQFFRETPSPFGPRYCCQSAA